MWRHIADCIPPLSFPSSKRLTTDYEAARLERAKEDAKWREYDEPTYLRRVREETTYERRG